MKRGQPFWFVALALIGLAGCDGGSTGPIVPASSAGAPLPPVSGAGKKAIDSRVRQTKPGGDVSNLAR
jgi:hypothetical protein